MIKKLFKNKQNKKINIDIHYLVSHSKWQRCHVLTQWVLTDHNLCEEQGACKEKKLKKNEHKIEWAPPLWFFYQKLPFESLKELGSSPLNNANLLTFTMNVFDKTMHI